MKPIPQLDPKQSSARNDERAPRRSSLLPKMVFEYQPTTQPAAGPAAASGKKFIKLETFRKLSGDYLIRETPRDFATELGLFIFVGGISIWSLMSTAVAITRMVRGW